MHRLYQVPQTEILSKQVVVQAIGDISNPFSVEEASLTRAISFYCGCTRAGTELKVLDRESS